MPKVGRGSFMFFRKRKSDRQRLAEKEAIVSATVKKHKKQTESAVATTKKSTDQFNLLMRKNHITFRIYSATHSGGK